MHSRSNGYQASLRSDPMTFLKHEQLQCSIVYSATWQFLILMENAKMLYYNAQARINEVFKSIVWETWGKMQPCFASYFRGKYSLRWLVFPTSYSTSLLAINRRGKGDDVKDDGSEAWDSASAWPWQLPPWLPVPCAVCKTEFYSSIMFWTSICQKAPPA